MQSDLTRRTDTITLTLSVFRLVLAAISVALSLKILLNSYSRKEEA